MAGCNCRRRPSSALIVLVRNSKGDVLCRIEMGMEEKMGYDTTMRSRRWDSQDLGPQDVLLLNYKLNCFPRMRSSSALSASILKRPSFA